MRLRSTRRLLAAQDEVWALLSEPYHLADWWPGYSAVRPDRRGLAVGARWTVTRSDRPGLLRTPRGEGTLVITRVEPPAALGWRDVQQALEVAVTVRPVDGQSEAAVELTVAAWRVPLEGLRRVPEGALARLHALWQTAERLR
jgi:uncharacterized protein YndB with AHSA1/START domain